MSRRIDWVLPHGRVLERMALREVGRRLVQVRCPQCLRLRMGLLGMRQCRVCGMPLSYGTTGTEYRVLTLSLEEVEQQGGDRAQVEALLRAKAENLVWSLMEAARERGWFERKG